VERKIVGAKTEEVLLLALENRVEKKLLRED